MPLFTDYHTHPLAHDPHRVYSQELLEEWIQMARSRGIRDLAFTDHDRFLKGIDLDLVSTLQEKHAPQLKLRMGIELDNDPETSEQGYRWTKENHHRLDFVLGSIHFIGEWPYDHPDHRKEFENREILELYKTYFAEIRRIAQDPIYDTLAHLDLIKIFGYAPAQDWTSIMEETLDTVKRSGKAMEVSTAGWHKPVKEQYPSETLIRMAHARQIPITTASDAHASAHLARDYDRLYELIKGIGYREVAIFEKHRMELVPLE